MSRSTYIRIESGTHVTDTTQLARLCSVFDLHLTDFFQRVEDRMAAGCDTPPLPPEGAKPVV